MTPYSFNFGKASLLTVESGRIIGDFASTAQAP